MNERDERESVERVVRETTFNRGKNIFSAIKVPRLCPFVLLAKEG
jgi:hypothetical protein